MAELDLLRLRLEALPAAMVAARRWLVWKQGKVPHYVSGLRRSGRLDSQDDLERLGTLDAALGMLARDGTFLGLGFALGYDPALGKYWQGLDLDAALAGADFTTDRARELYQATDGYAERSPSGKGLHVLGLGEAFRAVKWKRPGEQAVELYSAGRFFTVTGQAMRDGGLPDLAPLAHRVRAELLAAGKVRERKARGAAAAAGDYLERMPADLREWVRAHPIEAALAEHGYEREGDRWISPRSESGIPGVVVLDELRAVTFHASDAGIGTEVAGDGEVFNAFDAAVRYRFADDRRAALRTLLERTRTEQTTGTGDAGPGAGAADDAKPPQESPATGFRAIAAPDFVRQIGTPEYVLDGILQRGFVYCLTGPTGAGKTAVALGLAACTALRQPFAGRDTEGGPVLYVASENPDDVRARVLAWAAWFRVPVEELGDALRFVDESFVLHEREADLHATIARVRPSLVVLDTDQALAGSEDENSNAERIAHAKRVRALSRLPGSPCVVDLCHPPAGAQRTSLRPRGGSAFLAEVDGNLCLWRDDGAELVELFRGSKFRGPDFDALSFELRTVEVEALRDSRGRPMLSVVAVPTTAEDDLRLSKQGRERLLAVLRDISMSPDASQRQRVDATGLPRSTVQRAIGDLLARGAIKETLTGHEVTERGKKWLVAAL